MDDLEYFELDGPLSEYEAAFFAALRARVEGRYYLAWCGRSHDGVMTVGLHVDAPELALLTIGAHLDNGRIRGDRVDHQTYALPDQPTDMALDVTGSPADLAAHTANWFEAILRRPIVRYEWLHAGRVYADRYLFEDTGEGLAEMYRDDFAPPGQTEQLIARGYVRGKGWIDTSGLGEPHRVIAIRGDS